MKKNKEVDTELNSEESQRFAFEFCGFRVFVGSRQYTVFYPGEGKNKDKKVFGYFINLMALLLKIREKESKNVVRGSQTLEAAIQNLEQLNLKYEKLIEPLKKLDRI